MRDELLGFFDRERIAEFAVLPLSQARVTKPYMLSRAGLRPGTGSVLLFCVPYFSENGHGISAYAVAEDYHLYFEELFSRLCPFLHGLFAAEGDFAFHGFSDHSPIDERGAAEAAGVGFVGKNGLLITEIHSSYVFIGEVISDMPPANYGIAAAPHIPSGCGSCRMCESACPLGHIGGDGECLSRITQKKGELDAREENALRENGAAWGCDICQRVCPYTAKATGAGTLRTQVPYFLRSLITEPTAAMINAMEDGEFLRRAYSWRGRETIVRNLMITGKTGREWSE